MTDKKQSHRSTGTDKDTSPPPPLPRKRKALLGRLIALVVVLGLLGGVVAVIALVPKRDRGGEPVPPSRVNVEVMVVHPVADMSDTFEIDGSVEPVRTVKVAAEVAGAVLRRAGRYERKSGKTTPEIDEGDTVVAGQPVLLLDKALLKAQRDAADARRRFDRLQYERLKKLAEQDFSARKDLDDAQKTWEMSEASYEAAQTNLDKTTIRAPIGGVLNKIQVEDGEYVQPGTPVFEIVDTSKTIVAVDVPERDIDYFRGRLGTTHFVVGTAAGKLDRPIPAKITYISKVADPASRTTRVELTVSPAEAQRLFFGQIVRVRLTRRLLQDVIMVPLMAVIPQDRGFAVYTVSEGQAEKRPVDLNVRMVRGVNVQVLSGLYRGDRLIVKGQQYCSPQQPVHEPHVVLLASRPDTTIRFTGPVDVKRLQQLAAELADKLRKVPGVDEVAVFDGNQQEAPLLISREKLRAAGVTVEQLRKAYDLPAELPGENGRISLIARAPSGMLFRPEIPALVIAMAKDAKAKREWPVYVSEVAEVQPASPLAIPPVGDEAVQLVVRRGAAPAGKEVTDKMDKVLDTFRQRYPEVAGYKLTVRALDARVAADGHAAPATE